MKITDTHVLFWGERDIFSNFYRKPFFYRGKTIPCSEVGFMIEKALEFGDNEIARALSTVKDPKQAKALGRKIRNYDDAIWNEVRYERMKDVLRVKFRDGMLRKLLMSTGDKMLVEASPYDSIWGIGMGVDNPDIEDTRKWKGQNLLGKALMDIRSEILEEISK